GLAGEGRVDLGVDLKAVLVIAPYVDAIVAVAVEETAEEIAFLVLKNPTAPRRTLDQLDLAGGELIGRRRGANHTFLTRAEFQHILGFGGRRRGSRRQPQQQAARQPTSRCRLDA